MSAQIYLHPISAGDPVLISAIEIKTQHVAVAHKGNVLLIPRRKIEMLEIVTNALKEFQNEAQRNA